MIYSDLIINIKKCSTLDPYLKGKVKSCYAWTTVTLTGNIKLSSKRYNITKSKKFLGVFPCFDCIIDYLQIQ